MKKILSLFLAVVLVASSVILGSFNLTTGAETSGYYEYKIQDGKAVITGVDTSISGAVTIPSKLGGYAVSTIDDDAFNNCEKITSVVIPEGVTTLGSFAFYSCDSLTSVSMPSTIVSINEYTFSTNSALKTIDVNSNNKNYCDINGVLFNKTATILLYYPESKTDTKYTIPSTVTEIGEYAFDGVDYLTNVTIPSSVKTIADNNFYSCDSLISVNIADGVTSIGKWVFSGCYELQSITIPKSVTSIGDWSFASNTSFTAINVDSNNKNFSSVGGVLFNKNATTLIRYPSGKTNSSYTIPNGVTVIDKSAFYSADALTKITIPDSVKTIRDGAFEYCGYYNNESNWSNGVLYIGKYLIEADYDLSGSYKVKTGTTFIADNAFNSCSSLTAITIPDTVTTIGEYAFPYAWDYKDYMVYGYKNSYIHTYATQNEINFTVVEKPKYILGDVTDDTVINNKDLGKLMQYINKWDVDIVLEAADVNVDGKINNKDYGILAQYINKWDVELG